MLQYLFWITLSLLAYVYVGYPLVLWFATRLARNGHDGRSPGQAWPTLTLVISAYNEEKCIRDKIENSLSLDYPADPFEIVVVSDASDDRTDAIVEEYSSRGVRLLRQSRRAGKTSGLNAAVDQAYSEIIVFSDANAQYRSDALRHLAARFNRPDVGAVIGESSYVEPESPSGKSESMYWKYETTIKALESANGSVVGGDGAIYAVRRDLYKPMADGDLSDFVNPLDIIRSGYDCVYEPNAVSYEGTADSFAKEYKRKVRIVNRAWRGLWKMRELLNPINFGLFSIKLWSHKVLRWLVPVFLAVLFAVNVNLLNEGAVYRIAFIGQCSFYVLAAIGYTTRRRTDQAALIRVPYYFCLVNAAAAVALYELLTGKSYTTWNTPRS